MRPRRSSSSCTVPDIVVPGGGARPPKPKRESEAQFQKRVVVYAEKHGWDWMHVPRSASKGAWRTQTTGTLGVGWPDLFLLRAGRIMFFELKADDGDVRPEQRRVLTKLGQAVECYVIRPRDWPQLVNLLA